MNYDTFLFLITVGYASILYLYFRYVRRFL